MNEKNKNILLAVLIVGVISMTIAFAALTTNLKLQGTANVAATSWNIHFQNWALDTQNTVDGHQNTAEYPAVNQLTMSDSSNVTKVEGINVTLKQPGDYVKYIFEIKNDGSIAADLDSFEKTLECANNADCSHISYEVKCYESNTRSEMEIEEGSTLAVGGIAYCYLEVKYNDQTNTSVPGQNQIYTQGATSASLSSEWTFIQQQNNFIYQTPSGTSNTKPTAKYYLKTNAKTGYTEVCGVFPNKTVCLVNSPTGYSLSGEYISSKIEELQDAGAECSVDHYYGSVLCTTGSVNCRIDESGNVNCGPGYGNNGCGILPNGEYGC